MNPAMSRVADVDSDEAGGSALGQPTLVSLHYIRKALRRRWLVIAVCGLLGLLAGVGFLVLVPPAQQARVTLLLSHDSQVDAGRAMATDVGLLSTRTVAAETIAGLGLSITPDDLLESVTVEPGSSDVMVITVEAPSRSEARQRAETLASVYLRFRVSPAVGAVQSADRWDERQGRQASRPGQRDLSSDQSVDPGRRHGEGRQAQ